MMNNEPFHDEDDEERTMNKSKPEPSSWDIKMQRRQEFCKHFVREHHPGMADAHKIKGAHPLKPLGGPAYLRDGGGNMATDWWLQTNDSISALGFVWLAHLFDRHGMFDHAWMIGRSDQEAWALVSEPYSHIKPETVEKLRRELEAIGVALIQYPSEQSTHAPGHALMLVANVTDIHSLVGAVARVIVGACPPLRIDDDEECIDDDDN